MANIKLKFDTRKLQKDLEKSLNKIIKEENEKRIVKK